MGFATEIKLFDLTPETRQLLEKFLSRRHWDGRHITRGGIYWVGWTPVYFSHDLLIRKTIGNVWRCDVIDDKPCGKGQAGTVYKVLAVMHKKRGSLHEVVIDPKQTRVFKYQENSATTEFLLMKRCDTMKVRGIYHGMPTLFSMKKFDGVLLDEALNAERPRNEVRSAQEFTIAQRYQITISLLRALKKQMHENMILHRDIKPDNIFYDAVSGKISIFDLDVSELIGGEPDMRSRGNAMYTAPEDFISTITHKPVTLNEFRYSRARESHYTVKSDLYSMARVIGLVWRDVDSIFLDKNSDHKKMMIDRILRHWEPNYKLFAGIAADMSGLEKNLIERQLRAMTAIDPRERPDLNHCIDYFDRLYLEYKIQNLRPELHASFRHAHQVALDTLTQLDDIEIMHDLQRRMYKTIGASHVNMRMSLANALQLLRNNDQEILAMEIEEFCRPREIIPARFKLGEFLKLMRSDSTIASLISVMREALQNLPDDEHAVTEFIETIDARCLVGIKSRQQLDDKLTSLVNEYVDSDVALKQFYDEMRDLNNQEICDELNHMSASLKSQRLSLDNIAQSSRHVISKIEKIRSELRETAALRR